LFQPIFVDGPGRSGKRLAG